MDDANDPRSGSRAEVEVPLGSAQPDLDWVVTTAGDGASMMTMLTVYRGGTVVAGAGFGGPGLYPGAVMNEWRGRTDDLPYFVMARTAPESTGWSRRPTAGRRSCCGCRR